MIAAQFLAALAEEQQAENVWVEDVRAKIDAAISASEQTPPIDGETFITASFLVPAVVKAIVGTFIHYPPTESGGNVKRIITDRDPSTILLARSD